MLKKKKKKHGSLSTEGGGHRKHLPSSSTFLQCPIEQCGTTASQNKKLCAIKSKKRAHIVTARRACYATESPLRSYECFLNTRVIGLDHPERVSMLSGTQVTLWKWLHEHRAPKMERNCALQKKRT
ncbi:unnamed protein product [Ixodes pacificus]